MEFGFNFFPDVGPEEKSPADYWRESLHLAELGETLGYGHVRTVEHYFTDYGGYSPNPLIFLTAASQRTKKMRLITGAILPIFNNPIKIAAEIAEVDAISGGRLEVGFARAFLPHEFRRFGRALDESKARFYEGVEVIRRLLEEERVTFKGEFHELNDVTSLPRPTQTPRPQFLIAATSSADSFANAGKNGHWLMTIPRDTAAIREFIAIYRDAWRAAGHPGNGKVIMGLHMLCAPSDDEAVRIAEPQVHGYLKSHTRATADWEAGTSSSDYPNHPALAKAFRELDLTKMRKGHTAWVGSPAFIRDQVAAYNDAVGGFDAASLQVNTHLTPPEFSERSIRLFAEEVMPHFAGAKADAAAE